LCFVCGAIESGNNKNNEEERKKGVDSGTTPCTSPPTTKTIIALQTREGIKKEEGKK